MFNRKYDTFYFGILIGTITPIFIFALFYFLFDTFIHSEDLSNNGFGFGFRIRTFSLVSLASNAILMQYCRKRYAINAMRGITIPTFVFIIIWLIYFSSEII
ncbi:hypothetical protein [Membranihabitans marinus]|uniref:hypothetical protein n=1 Tax=Membranihabitans marinus TaxID=1227546 RepID=UPI001F3B2817|nr:hypothetical protein [Membranihabitans marinus]